MTNSENIGTRILLLRKSIGLNQSEFARKLGFDGPITVSRYERQQRIPDLSTVEKLSKITNTRLDWLITGEGPKYREEVPKNLAVTDIKEIEKKIGIKCTGPNQIIQGGEYKPHQLPLHPNSELNSKDYVLVPYLDAHAAEQLEFIGGGQARCHLAFSKYWIEEVMRLDPGQILITSVIGDSMEPTLKEGDILLVDRRKKEIKEDAIYVISIKDLIMPKRVQRMFNGIICIKSDNPAYKEQIIPKDVSADLHVIGRAVWVGRKI